MDRNDEAQRRVRSPTVLALPKHTGSPAKMLLPPAAPRMKQSIVTPMRAAAAAATTRRPHHLVKPKRAVVVVPKLSTHKKRKRPIANSSSNQWTSVACTGLWGATGDAIGDADSDDNDADERAINAGVYVLENTKTGHCHMGTTWDLRNAAAQCFADLASGTHPHAALVTCFQLYGATASGICYRVVEHVAAPVVAVSSTAAQRRTISSSSADAAVDVAKMEQLLQRRLRAHMKTRVRKHALQLVRRLVVQPYLARYWPRWTQFVAQQQLAERVAAAVDLQRVARGAIGRSHARTRRRERAAYCLQQFARLCVAKCVVARRTRSRRQDASARVLQRSVRQFLQQRVCKRRRCIVRRWLCARRIQSFYRGHCGRRVVTELRHQRLRAHASTTIQRFVRGFLTRCAVRRQRCCMHEHRAAITIQTRWRGVSARATFVLLKREFECRTRAAVMIQRRYLRFAARQLHRTAAQLAHAKRHAMAIHTAYRDYVARKFGWAALSIALETTMASRIQRAMLCWRIRRKLTRLADYARADRCASVVQRTAREWLARRCLHQLRQMECELRAAQRLQRAWRACRWLRHVAAAASYRRRDRSALRIQTRFRSHRARRRFVVERDHARRDRAAVRLQCLYRSRCARREWRRRLELRAQGPCEDCGERVAALYSLAFSLELCGECWQDRYAPAQPQSLGVIMTLPVETYRRLRKSLVATQHAYRAYQRRLARAFGVCRFCTRHAVREHCDACGGARFCHSCTALLHARFKHGDAAHTPMAIEVFERRKHAATLIQAHVRCFLQRHTVLQLRKRKHDAAACRIQRVVVARQKRRATRAVCAAHKARILAEQTAALRLQSVFRGHCARQQHRQLRCERESAIRIQRLVRGRRGRLEAQTLRQRRDAATTIQRLVRGVWGRRVAAVQSMERQHTRQRRAAVCIQRRARGRLARKLVFEAKRDAAAQTIQRVWRCTRARAERQELLAARRRHESKLEEAARVAQAAQRIALECEAATRIQTLARRWLVRNELQTRSLVRARITREQLCIRALQREQASATRIQRFVRAKWLRAIAHRRLAVHCCARQFLSRRALQQRRRTRRAAITVQRAFRHARARRALVETVAAAIAQSPWVELFDDASGCVYFFNTVTLESSWERPPELTLTDEDASDDSEWLEYWDENVGASYYYNTKTGEATWTTPDGVATEVYYAPERDDNQAVDDVAGGSVFRTLPPKTKSSMARSRAVVPSNQVTDALCRTAPARSIAPSTTANGSRDANNDNGNQMMINDNDDGSSDAVYDYALDDDDSAGVDSEYDINYKIFLTQLERDTQQQHYGDNDNEQHYGDNDNEQDEGGDNAQDEDGNKSQQQ